MDFDRRSFLRATASKALCTVASPRPAQHAGQLSISHRFPRCSLTERPMSRRPT